MAASAPRVAAPRGGGVTPARRIRVLHVITSLTVGGAERLVISAVRGLPSDRYEHAICCLAEPGARAAEAAGAGVPVVCIGGFPGLRHPLAFARLFRVIRRASPTIVHTHLQSANLYGRAAARLAAVPIVIATEHNVYTQKPRRYVMVERQLARATDVLIAVSTNVQQFLSAQLALPASAIRVVRNGVAPAAPSPDRVAALRARAGDGAPIVAVVASLTRKKGHDCLLRAIAMLRERGVACHVLLAGEGPERVRLESLAADLGLGGVVQFLGALPGSADVLAVADLFVLPSIAEGMPLALLEAMQAGKAVVATAVGGVPEVIQPEVNGILVPPADAPTLADAMARLAASRNLREQLGAEAQRTVAREYTEAAYLAALDAIYTEAAGRRST